MFDLASLTKVLATAPLIMRLVERGRLALDDSISLHLSSWQDEHGAAPVTIRDLLAHCAGLAAHLPFYRGHRGRAEFERDLMEWNYGEYEGLTTSEIRSRVPGWMIFRDGCPGGESPEQIGARVDRVIARVRTVQGNVALFAHGHVFRVFAARWLGLAATAGSHFLLHTATLNILSYYREVPAVQRWNAPLAI